MFYMSDATQIRNGYSMQLSTDLCRERMVGSRRVCPRVVALCALGAMLLHAALVTALLLVARAPMTEAPETIDVSLVMQPSDGSSAPDVSSSTPAPAFPARRQRLGSGTRNDSAAETR